MKFSIFNAEKISVYFVYLCISWASFRNVWPHPTHKKTHPSSDLKGFDSKCCDVILETLPGMSSFKIGLTEKNNGYGGKNL